MIANTHRKESLLERQRESMRKEFSHLLLSIGFPRNKHIYDIDKEYLSSLGSEEAKTLLKIIEIYNHYDGLQKELLVNSVLEKEFVYPFWWHSYYSEERAYRHDLKEVVRDGHELFKA